MIERFDNLRVTVAGLGRFGGGIAVSRWLAGRGARVLVTDRDPPEKLQSSVDQLAGLPIEFVLGRHREQDFCSCDLLVVSPAIPPTNPFVAIAREAGVPLTTEIALFAERCRGHTIGVTGTKGKSTTATLIHRMISARRRALLGGNIGVSLLDQLDQILPDDVVVLELSSFMLHWLGEAKWSPDVAVLTMIGTDHLDWHGDVASYHRAKANIVRFQRPHGRVVVDSQHAHSMAIASAGTTKATIVPANPRRLDLKLPGEHNQRNAQLARAAATGLGVDFDTAQAAVVDFAGLSHRLEVVHDAAGVKWVNDSIATIPEAAVAANRSFDVGRVIQIVGGYDKGLDLAPMTNVLSERCKAVLTIGTLGPTLAATIGARAIHAQTLAAAVRHARSIAAPGDVVLLSTGCASYDQFANFQDRGDTFARLARQSTDDA
jgi:UDP-N-acetylmuramoylalanine--D-glutamate ligase